MKIKALLGTLILVSAGAANTAMAVEKGDWLVRFGASNVDPKSDNHPIVSVDDGSSFTANVAYMFTANLSVELLAAYPFEHDITAGGAKVASTKHLPPTLALQYHFLPKSAFQPYVGAGVNYTIFFDEDMTGALEGANLDLDASFGVAAQVGADFDVSDRMFLNFDIRWIDIETEATVSSAGSPDLVFDVDIDPMVYSLALGWKF